jgi:outer membrane lipoprotein-sorting protein
MFCKQGLPRKVDTMRYVLALLLLPALLGLSSALAQENEAEKLFRAVEKKIKAARAIQVASEIHLQEKEKQGKFKASLLLARDDKAQLKLSGELDGKEMKMEVLSDGKQLKVHISFFPEAKEQPLPKKFHDTVSALVSRVGLLGGMFIVRNKEDEEKEVDVEKLFPLSDFKMEAAEKVGGRDTKVMSYTVVPDKKEARVTLWVDANTLLPLKRLIVPKGENDRFTETYTQFTLNPKIDPKTSESPMPLPGIPSLTGRITVKGQPLKDGIVSFYPAVGKPRSTGTDRQGRYTWKDAAPGAVKIVLDGEGIPAQYKSVTTTPLKTTISKSGATTYNIEVK